MSISILMLWRPLRLGPSRHSSFIISSAHERKTEICARVISSWLDVLGRMPAGRWSEWGNQDIFWNYKKVTNERTCERLRHRALSWWLISGMLCNRRVREDGKIPCSATHTSQLNKKYHDWKTVLFHNCIVKAVWIIVTIQIFE